ncbi:MAG: prepilin-type N-terminal cleavage/methylation domain-containing protein [Sedimentisphaerales bacterium]|nr:prepilin-type N-terminal cleavage/methylation domain-containing protein [Sedimentisphaerales bacterium]
MKYEIRNTKYERRAFTLVELVVAVGIMAMVILFAGTIFKESIGSYRAASAQAEIMQKLRVITDQLDSDFKGLRKDAPLFIWFHQHDIDARQRFDQIMFFADGDFQSTGLWANKPVVGNLARIYYGQTQNSLGLEPKKRILARRQHISTADLALDAWPNPANFAATFNLANNDIYEHDRISLSQWQALMTQDVNVSFTIEACIGRTGNSRPMVNLASAQGLHMLMTEGVSSFSIQWSYNSTLTGSPVLWWPSVDPEGDGQVNNPNDFNFNVSFPWIDRMGFFFNAVKPIPLFVLWNSYDNASGPYYPVIKPVYPQALKFTFTLYDSKGVFREGQTFTHIVYLGD